MEVRTPGAVREFPREYKTAMKMAVFGIKLLI